MRGGPSLCFGNRYVKRGERKILKQDMKNFYGWSMSNCLPTGEFHAIEITKRNQRRIYKIFLLIPDKINCGYLLECDLEFPSIQHR